MVDISYLGDLNREQEKAVRQTDGAVLVLAGAGTGKTKALTARVAYLIRKRVSHIPRCATSLVVQVGVATFIIRLISILQRKNNIGNNIAK